MESLELIILSNLIHNESFVRRAIPHIKSEYFNGQHRVIYDLILEFVSKFNKLPNSTTLDIDYRASDNIDRNDRNEILHTIKSLSEYTPVDMDWLLIETEKFCKDRAINLAIIEAVSIIDGKNPTLATGAIPELLAKALAVSFDSSVGHSYIGDSEDRYEFYHRKETKIPFDIDILNKITNGGVTKKTLNIILAGVHVGKSLGLCHMAAAALASGKNSLYITLEMAEERIAERIDANLFDVNIKDISNLSKNSFDNKIKGITSKSKGDLIIKEYPTGAAHVGHFRALLMELKQKKNFVPDIIFIDYMNICTSSRIKGGLSGSVNTYSLIKSIAEEIRGLAVEFNVPIWTATQLNRTGYSNSDADMTDTSESWGTPQTADMLLAFIRTEELDKCGQIMVKQLKNRYASMDQDKRFTVGIDISKMRLYDIADPTANIMKESAPALPDVKQTPFMAGSKPKGNFKDFKM